MRKGFTTGSCAAAAARAAASMLLFGSEIRKVSIDTPAGVRYQPDLVDITIEPDAVSCAVVKDGGDDPDVTTGAHVFARVSVVSEEPEGTEDAAIRIEGGPGVGRVTKPGLDQPVGSAAINRVPREMIRKEVSEICRAADFHGILSVEISIPEGEALAEKTFNPRLGIVGGISVIGTSGIVEPMSTEALLETIRVELRQRKAEGYRCAAVSPGNYGLDFMKQAYGYDLDLSVKCSNFIGDTIDMAAELGFESLLLTGNIGKLVKVAGGIMNTHSKEGDCRMELLAAAALRAGVPAEILRQVLDCVMTDEGLRLIRECGRLEETMAVLMDRIMFYLKKRAGGRLAVECILYSNQYGELAKSEGAEKWLTLLVQDRARST